MKYVSTYESLRSVKNFGDIFEVWHKWHNLETLDILGGDMDIRYHSDGFLSDIIFTFISHLMRHKLIKVIPIEKFHKKHPDIFEKLYKSVLDAISEHVVFSNIVNVWGEKIDYVKIDLEARKYNL